MKRTITVLKGNGLDYWSVFLIGRNMANFIPPRCSLLSSTLAHVITMTDQSGNGWLVEAHFAIAHGHSCDPEPSRSGEPQTAIPPIIA